MNGGKFKKKKILNQQNLVQRKLVCAALYSFDKVLLVFIEKVKYYRANILFVRFSFLFTSNFKLKSNKGTRYNVMLYTIPIC